MEKSQIQSEALEAIGDRRKAGVDASMGSGKTLIGIKHMASNYNEHSRFLVVAHKTSAFKSWKKDMKEFKMEYLIPHVKFSTYLSLNKKDQDYDGVYLDECHNLKLSHNSWLSSFSGKILGLTGTPPTNPFSEAGKMVNWHCPIVYTYKIDNAVKDGLINDYRIVVWYLNLDKTRTMKMSRAGGTSFWYTSEQASYEYWTEQIEEAAPAKVHMTRLMRMKAMQNFPSKERFGKTLLQTMKDKCLIFANTRDQADRLCDFSYHSTNKKSEGNLELFVEGNIRKLSAVNQLNEGVNIPGLKEGIILHAFGNERVTPQKIGRFLRLNPSDIATVNILCFKDTIDEEWIKSALIDFDPNKITYKESRDVRL